MSTTVKAFYRAVQEGDVAALEGLIDDGFCLICPTRDHVLSGVYEGKARFFNDVLPRVFGCVNPEEIAFCQAHQIVVEAGEVVVAMAQNAGLAKSGERYDQIYLHVFKIRAGKIVALIEGFDTALANRALWQSGDPLVPDHLAALSNLAQFQQA